MSHISVLIIMVPLRDEEWTKNDTPVIISFYAIK